MKKKNIWMIATGAVAALAGGLLFIKKKKAENNDDTEKPPKDAPQLNIQNPGSQDDFPSAARESEIG
jgi:LPXTG-motif cell wall-anchored protein